MVATPAENANKTVETVKERSNMIKSRIASHLSQKEVARIMSVDIKSVINWEKAHTTPHLYQIKPLRDAINFIGSDEELLQIFPVGESVTVQVSGIVENGSEKPAFPQPCRTETNRAILESSGPSPFVIHIPGSVKGFREFMDMLRRQFIEALAKFNLTAVLGNVSLALISSPTVDPEEYLSLVGASIGTWWEWFNQGNFNKLEEVLHG